MGIFDFFHARSVAGGGELVRALIDKHRFRRAHIPVHGGETQQDVREHPHEYAGVVRAPARVVLRYAPEKQGRQKIPAALAHGSGQTPEKPLGLRPAAGVQLVCGVDVFLRHGGCPAPEPKGTVRDKLVQRRRKAAAGGPVKCLRIGDIGTVQLFRRTPPGRRHTIPSPFSQDTAPNYTQGGLLLQESPEKFLHPARVFAPWESYVWITGGAGHGILGAGYCPPAVPDGRLSINNV
jgi:hypothetical protein